MLLCDGVIRTTRQLLGLRVDNEVGEAQLQDHCQQYTLHHQEHGTVGGRHIGVRSANYRDTALDDLQMSVLKQK